MRILVALVGAMLVACATQQPPKQAVPAGPQVKVDAKNVQSVMRSGHKIVDEKGRTLYCKTEAKTGSRLQKTTTCLTEEQWDALAEASRVGVERASSSQPPPQGR
jgi:predicted transglutaminase-like cysteine proteinase